MKRNTKRITVDLEGETYRELRIHCAEEQIRMADVVRKLLQEYLAKVKKPKRT